MDRLCESGPGANIGLSHAPVETRTSSPARAAGASVQAGLTCSTNVCAGGGRTFGVRHRHLDPHINPEDPSSASYNPTCATCVDGLWLGIPWCLLPPHRATVVCLRRHNSPFDPVKLKKERERTKKHPKLGIRLKSRRSIDAAIGTPIPPGPGAWSRSHIAAVAARCNNVCGWSFSRHVLAPVLVRDTAPA